MRRAVVLVSLFLTHGAIAAPGAQSFLTAYPDSQREVGRHDYLVRASGFHAEMPSSSSSPEKAAREFLDRFGDDFGVHTCHTLVVDGADRAGEMSLIRMHVEIDGVRVIGSSVVVDVAPDGAVTYLTVADVADQKARTRFSVEEAAAVTAARHAAKLPADATVATKTQKGWLDDGGDKLRPVWQIDLGEWRVLVYADDGRIASTRRRGDEAAFALY